jgi:hypothetical protein
VAYVYDKALGIKVFADKAFYSMVATDPKKPQIMPFLLKKDAEAHAEEDRRRREEAESRNRAENLVYQTEKLLREQGDKITGDEKSPGSLRGADAAVRKLGDEPMPTVGGRTPRESFNYYFNQSVQTFAAERGVQPEALTADEVNHALWRAVARAKGDVTLHRTMTLPPIDPADPKAGHRLEWRRKATEYANQLLAGKEVDIDLPEPGKPGASASGRATILRVEMDPSLRKGAVRVLVQDNGRLVPLAFDSMADFSPEGLLKQIPALQELKRMRDALSGLKSPLENQPSFRRLLNDLVSDMSTEHSANRDRGN